MADKAVTLSLTHKEARALLLYVEQWTQEDGWDAFSRMKDKLYEGMEAAGADTTLPEWPPRPDED